MIYSNGLEIALSTSVGMDDASVATSPRLGGERGAFLLNTCDFGGGIPLFDNHDQRYVQSCMTSCYHIQSLTLFVPFISLLSWSYTDDYYALI